tara:strand:- start:34 stop:330 length:297 start_codon:yes stop_codon:yes gene_type:complete
MKNLIKISFFTMIVLILIGCSVDEDVQKVADDLVNEERGITEDIAMCMAKEQKANLSSEDWDVVVGMVDDTADMSDLSKDAFNVFMASGMECGAPGPG